MQEININVRVQLGLTDNLFSVLSAIAGRCATPGAVAQPAPVEKVINKEAPAVAAATAEPEAPAVAAAPAEDEKPKELTEEDVRAAMHRTRTRIEGEDYKENTDGEKYQKYHKQLTANFKNISALLGADKPSALPADKRESFIKQCDELVIGDDGTITTKVPF